MIPLLLSYLVCKNSFMIVAPVNLRSALLTKHLLINDTQIPSSWDNILECGINF